MSNYPRLGAKDLCPAGPVPGASEVPPQKCPGNEVCLQKLQGWAKGWQVGGKVPRFIGGLESGKGWTH